MITSIEIVRRVLDALRADADGPPMSRTTLDGSAEVGILRVPDSPVRGVDVRATVDASAFETPVTTPDGRPLRVEYVATADAAVTLLGDAVASCAFRIGPRIAVRPGTVYRGAIGRRYPATTTPHLMSITPFVRDAETAPFDDADADVTWLQLIPITADEAEFVAANDGDALMDAFVDDRTDLFSITRPSVPLDRRPVTGR